MSPDEHIRLEEWAKKFAVLGLLGFLSVLLMIGKGLHHLLLYRGYVCRIGVIPSSILSGLLGLIWMFLMESIDKTLTYDLNIGLNSLKITMVNFMFASLTLGLFCTRTTSQHSNLRAIFQSILHEGIPMVIYSQILIWGQSCVCLLIYCLFYLTSPDVPHLVSAMVPLGIEAGDDVIPTAIYKNSWSKTVVQEAESLGLFAACFLGIIAVSVKNRYIRGFWNQNNYGRNDFYVRNHSGSAEFEAFGKTSEYLPSSSSSSLSSSTTSATTNISPVKPRRSSSTSLTPSLSQRNVFSTSTTSTTSTAATLSTSQQQQQIKKPSQLTIPPSPTQHYDKINSPTSHSQLPSTHPLFTPYKSSNVNSTPHSSLGTHLSVIFLAVFLAFNFGLFSRIIESKSIWLKSHRIVSSIRMFELSIISSFFLIYFFLSFTSLTFKSEWFMRIGGLTLDMIIIASLTVALPRPDQIEQVNYGLISIFVIACALWNIFVFIFLGRKMFPNFWFERSVTLTGEALGHSVTGLLFVRTLDPSMNTPVPFSYLCKLMLFTIFPSSGGKNTIVVTLVDSHGPWVALLVCCFVVLAWGFIFEKYIRGKYIHNSISLSTPLSSSNISSLNSNSLSSLQMTGITSKTTDDSRDYLAEDRSRMRSSSLTGNYSGGVFGRSKSESEIFHENTPLNSSYGSPYETNNSRLYWLEDENQNEENNIENNSSNIIGNNNIINNNNNNVNSNNNLNNGILGDNNVNNNNGGSNNINNNKSVNNLTRPEEILEFDEEEQMLKLNDKTPLLKTMSNSNINSGVSSTNVNLNQTSQLLQSTLPTFRMNSVSGMLSPSHFSSVMSWILPEYQHSLVQLSLIYTLQRDGASLTTLLSLCCPTNTYTHSLYDHYSSNFHSHHSHNSHHSHHSHFGQPLPSPTSSSNYLYKDHQILILIEDSWGYIFGLYLSHPLKISSEYYGNDDDFVFTVLPNLVKYPSNQFNNYYILSNYQNILIGGGKTGTYTIQLDDELNTGVTGISETYSNNNILSSNEYFKCLNVEVWAIHSAIE